MDSDSAPRPSHLKYDAVLFDAAETLFTTRGSVGVIYGDVARQYGCLVPAEEIQSAFVRQFRHSGPLTTDDEKQWWKDVVHRVFQEVGGIRDFDRFFNEVYEQFRDARGWMLFPETSEVLKTLKRQSIRLGVISNFDSRVFSVMQSLGIMDYFDAVTISSETGFAKPDRRIFESAIRASKAPASRILYVGDNLADDVQAGAAAGLQTVLIDRTDRYPEVPGTGKIQSLSEIPLLLETGWPRP